jgi:hypothetical protein
MLAVTNYTMRKILIPMLHLIKYDRYNATGEYIRHSRHLNLALRHGYASVFSDMRCGYDSILKSIKYDNIYTLRELEKRGILLMPSDLNDAARLGRLEILNEYKPLWITGMLKNKCMQFAINNGMIDTVKSMASQSHCHLTYLLHDLIVADNLEVLKLLHNDELYISYTGYELNVSITQKSMRCFNWLIVLPQIQVTRSHMKLVITDGTVEQLCVLSKHYKIDEELIAFAMKYGNREIADYLRDAENITGLS